MDHFIRRAMVMCRFGSVTVLALLLLSACTSAPPPSGSPTDEIYKKERAKRQSYTESCAINACSDSGCYQLPANITHIFQDDGSELKRVNRIDFSNGGYIEFSDAYIGGSGTDSRGRVWTFSY